MLHVDWLTFLVVAMFFGATLLRSALGFGEARILSVKLRVICPRPQCQEILTHSCVSGIPFKMLVQFPSDLAIADGQR